jgi:hypothetical protein
MDTSIYENDVNACLLVQSINQTRTHSFAQPTKRDVAAIVSAKREGGK